MMDLTFRRFRPDTDAFKPFDCGNADLNGFLLEIGSAEPNASLSQKELLAETFYQKQHFKRLKDPAPDDETVLMYFDLKTIA